MSRVKTKKIKIPLGGQSDDISDLFNQMLGTGAVNMHIAYPRYKRIMGLCTQMVKLFELVASSPFMKGHPEFSTQRQQIVDFCAKSKEKLDEVRIDLSDYEWNLDLVESQTKTKFSAKYEALKKTPLVNTFVVMCDRLVPFKRFFSSADGADGTDGAAAPINFTASMPGVEWCPFPFTTLNLKYIFSMDSVGANTMGFFIAVLSKSYEYSRHLYDELQSPDIDVDQFVDFIMSNIDKIQKRPELSRCKEAFQKIRESVKLLKERFGGYYRDYVATTDNTIIMQHFILDVSKSTGGSPVVANQFRTIINFYRKAASDQISNPQVKALFDRINESFKDIEKGTENLVNIRGEDSG